MIQNAVESVVNLARSMMINMIKHQHIAPLMIYSNSQSTIRLYIRRIHFNQHMMDNPIRHLTIFDILATLVHHQSFVVLMLGYI